jgi:hypothetical protein
MNVRSERMMEAQLAEALIVAEQVLASKGIELKEVTRALARWRATQ